MLVFLTNFGSLIERINRFIYEQKEKIVANWARAPLENCEGGWYAIVSALKLKMALERF